MGHEDQVVQPPRTGWATHKQRHCKSPDHSSESHGPVEGTSGSRKSAEDEGDDDGWRQQRNDERTRASGLWEVHRQAAEEAEGGDAEEQTGEREGAGHERIIARASAEFGFRNAEWRAKPRGDCLTMAGVALAHADKAT